MRLAGQAAHVADRQGRGKLIRGTAWGVLGEGLALPTGFLTAAVLSRVFGPSDYGLYALAIGLVSLCQAGIDFLLTRPTIKFASQAEDPDPVARTVLRLHLLIGCLVGLLVAAAAPLVAGVLDEAKLTRLIRVFAWSLPLETLAQGHVGLLVGLGRYRERAFVRAAHWTARSALIVCLVLLGFRITGALVGALSASVVTLALARVWIRPSLRGPTLPLKPFLALGVPLLLAGMAGMARQRLDLFAFKSLGASAAEAGLYAAAQTLAAVPGALAMALGPLVLSTLNRAWSAGDGAQARKLTRDLLRAGLWLFPFAGLVAGAASELMSLVYGVDFEPGASVLSVLFVSSTTIVLVSTCGSVFIVTDRVKAMLAPSILGLVGALILYPILIPTDGSLGAALSTLGGSAVGLTLSLGLVWRIWGVAPPPATALRSLVISALAFWFASGWPSSPVWLLPKLALGTGGIVLAFLILGEFRDADPRALVRALSAGAAADD